jgi:hypothetical protein
VQIKLKRHLKQQGVPEDAVNNCMDKEQCLSLAEKHKLASGGDGGAAATKVPASASAAKKANAVKQDAIVPPALEKMAFVSCPPHSPPLRQCLIGLLCCS